MFNFSLEMDAENSERLMNAWLYPLTTWDYTKSYDFTRPNSTMVKMQYPAIYKVACVMNIEYFPWDMQHCEMTVE